MFDQGAVEATTHSRFVQGLDVSMFSEQDIVNVVLQRSEVLYDLESPGRPIRQWSRENEGPMRDVVQDKGLLLVQRAIAVLYREYLAMKPLLDGMKIKRIADIGCGYAFFDLFAARDYQAELVLIDIEENDERHFGFEETGAAYTSLSVATKFLNANGIGPKRVTAVNPKTQNLAAVPPVDLAISFLSCGFHYPASTYATFWKEGVAQDGHVILDVRGSSFDEQMAGLNALGSSAEIWEGQKWHRMVIDKGITG